MITRISWCLFLLLGFLTLAPQRPRGQSPERPSGPAAAKAGESSLGDKTFAEFDRLMDQLAKEAASFERCIGMKGRLLAESAKARPSESTYSGCQEPFSVDSVAQDYVRYASNTPDATGGPHYYVGNVSKVPDPEKGSALFKLIQYYECRAVAAGNRAPCASLNPTDSAKPRDLNFGETPEEVCLTGYQQTVLAKAIITGDPAAKTICDQLCAEDPGGLGLIPAKGQACSRLCHLIVDGRNAPGSLCAKAAEVLKATPASGGEGFLRMCQDRFFDPLYGNEKACRDVLLKNPTEALGDACQTAAAIRKAHAAGNRKACGGAPLCRAVMGEGLSSCKAHSERVKREYCSQDRLLSWPPESSLRREMDAKSVMRDKRSSQVMQLRSACDGLLRGSRESLSKAIGIVTGALPGTSGRDERYKQAMALQKKYGELHRKYLSSK